MHPLAATVLSMTVFETDPGPFPETLPDVPDPVLQGSGFFIGFVVVVLVGWLVVEPAISRIISRRNRNNPTIEEAISRYIRLSILVGALFVGLSLAGFSDLVGNSALVIAAGTLAVGVAGGSVIGSLVSGIALVVDPRFNIGNYIRWEDGEGEVTSITLRVTRVRTLDGGLVTIPNTTLTDKSIVRPFEGGSCRTVERVEIAYDADIGDALSVLTDITGEIDGILNDPAPRVGVEELGDDAVVLRAQYWISDPAENTLPVRSTFARAVKNRFEGAGVEISPPSQRELEGRIQIDDAA